MPSLQETSESHLSSRQSIFIKFFSILGAFALILFGALQIYVEKNFIIGILEVFGGVVFILNFLIYKLHKKVGIAQIIMLANQAGFILIMLVSGGIQQSGLFWYFTFPITVFFLRGKKEGRYWIIMLYIVTGLSYFLSKQGVLQIAYEFIMLRQLSVSLLIVTFLVYLYQDAIDSTEEVLKKNRNELQEFIDSMLTFAAKVDINGKILFANKSAKIASGLGEDVIGIGLLDGDWFTHDKAVHLRISEYFHKALLGITTNKDEQVQVYVPNVGKKILSINLNFSPVKKNGEVIYVLVEGRDVTELKQAQEELKTRTEEAERLNALTVNRELEMIELKKKIKKLENNE